MARITLMLFLFPFISIGQVPFGTASIIENYEASGLVTMHAADLDNDGDLDILAGSYFDNKIIWYKNNGAYKDFTTAQVISLATYQTQWVYSADLDGDGDQDVLSASQGDNKIAWYENLDGQGNFGIQNIISINIRMAAKVLSADMDGDGDFDVVCTSPGSLFNSYVSWFENVDGKGNFGEERTISTGLIGANALALADMDSDGDIDVVTASQGGGGMAWYENMNGQGTFGQPNYISTEPVGTTSIWVADIDGDGDGDVLSTVNYGIADDEISWYENLDGNGNFSAQNLISTSADLPRSIKTGDLDGDGDLDVICASRNDHSVTWYENQDGQGGFASPQIITSKARWASKVIIADMNFDGNLDVISSSEGWNEIQWFDNDQGNGTYQRSQPITSQLVDIKSIHSADLDNDGDEDIIASSSLDKKLTWYRNDIGRFSRQIIIDCDINQSMITHVADLDNDDDLDIIVGTDYAGMMVWYENVAGNGTFSASQVISDRFDNTTLYADDLDGDGDLDIAAGGTYDHGIVWFENQGSANDFSEEQVISEEQKAQSLYIDDLDGDGDPDILATLANEDMIVWFENQDDQGSFGSEQIISTGTGATFITAADLDNDGDPDILSASRHFNKIAWYENQNGSFGNEQIITVQAFKAHSVYPADMDRDGDPDIVFTAQESEEITWFENNNADFSEEHFIAYVDDIVIRGANEVLPTDLNNDGNIDILAAMYDTEIVWFSNQFETPGVSGKFFFDENENGIYDESEHGLEKQRVTITPIGSTSFTNSSGTFQFSLPSGTYTIQASIPDSWDLTSDPSLYTVNVEDAIIDGHNFGLKPTEEMLEIDLSLQSASTRCGFQVPFWLDYENLGTTTSAGYLVLEIDELTDYLSAYPEPDMIDGNKLSWNYENLIPFSRNFIQVILQMPGVDFILETVEFSSIAYITESTGTVLDSFVTNYITEIGCAYDPNDKLVFPPGEGDEHYTEFGQDLDYTVRFQNTGTDTAFTIRIEDQLDPGLDWATFTPGASSHPYEVQLNDGGLVSFTFNNVLLPDSTTNEVASHGFVNFTIKPLEGLEEGTQIRNTASIFFDFNPPILTNTTLNTLVTKIPSNTSEHSESIFVTVSPNPFKEQTFLQVEKLPGNEPAVLFIRDIQGQLLQRYKLDVDSTQKLEFHGFASGLYFYEVRTAQTNDLLGSGRLLKY